MKLLIDKIKLKLLLEEKRDNIRSKVEGWDLILTGVNEILHRFSIVALKDDFNKYSNRFLLHYDTNWNCWFFFSFPTSDSANEEQIKNRMSNILKVDKNLIHLVHKSERLQPKYSLKDCVNKVYQHSLYQAVMGEFSPELKEDSFVLDGVSYKWMTIAEMEADDRIMEVNKDVVSFVKEKIE